MVNKRLEKYALFSENFRGLPDGWHNLRACNFLVGENSTGKSSFLQLIQLIDSREHSVFLDICGIVEGIDTPFDVCSRTSGSRETTIGFLIKERVDETRKSYRGVLGRLSTYKRVKNEMRLERLTVVSGEKILRMRRSQNRISYRLDNFVYDEKLKHSENGEKFRNLHSSSSERFGKHREINWQEVLPMSAWIETTANAVFGKDKLNDDSFVSSYPPLRCLHHGPMRTKTRRLYHGSRSEFSPTGEHIPYLLRDMLQADSKLNDRIVEFGKASGLFDMISVTSVKTAIKDKPFALQVEKSGSFYYVDELGFGVGQVLPIIADIAFASDNHAFLIQQPELHLHPRAQAALGDVFQTATENGGAFVIETHSDFIIDRFRLLKKKSKDESRAQIIYFEKGEDGKNRSFEIDIKSDGSLADTPEGYRSFFLNESVEKFENL